MLPDSGLRPLRRSPPFVGGEHRHFLLDLQRHQRVDHGGDRSFVAWYKGTQAQANTNNAYSCVVPIFGDPTGSNYMSLGLEGGHVAVCNNAKQAEGASLVLQGQRRYQDLERLVAARPWRERALCLRADVTDAQALEAAFESARTHFGRVDVCVANAGVWPPEELPLQHISEERLREVVAVDLLGAALGALVGCSLGFTVGASDGSSVGCSVGSSDGKLVSLHSSVIWKVSNMSSPSGASTASGASPATSSLSTRSATSASTCSSSWAV